MPSADFIHDLLEKIEEQKIDYFLITVTNNSSKEKDIKIFTSLPENDYNKLLNIVKKNKKKKENGKS